MRQRRRRIGSRIRADIRAGATALWTGSTRPMSVIYGWNGPFKRQTGQFETTPLVVDGVLYGTGQDDRAFALDARTGRAIWRYRRNLPEKIQLCCGRVNRGFAMLGNKLFMATLDAHVVALEARLETCSGIRSRPITQGLYIYVWPRWP